MTRFGQTRSLFSGPCLDTFLDLFRAGFGIFVGAILESFSVTSGVKNSTPFAMAFLQALGGRRRRLLGLSWESRCSRFAVNNTKYLFTRSCIFVCLFFVFYTFLYFRIPAFP